MANKNEEAKINEQDMVENDKEKKDADSSRRKEAKKNVQENIEVYTSTLNKLRQVVGDNKEYQKALKRDKDKARFRTKITPENFEKSYEELKDIKENLSLEDYTVDIIEDLEVKKVTKGGRYTIKVSKGKVFVEVDLLEYKEKINDFEFDVLIFWEEHINKINGGILKESVKVAKLVSQYLSYIMYFRDLFKVTYKYVGWDNYTWDNTEWIFKYEQIYARDHDIKGFIADKQGEGLAAAKEINYKELNLEDEIDTEEGKEYCNKWVEHTINLLNNHEIIALLIGAGVSGVIRSLLPYTKETNININIYGDPATGKSIIGHYILSIFGNPTILEGSFTDTDNAMEQKRVQRPILPYILDERMLKVEGKSDTTKEQTILMDIFREYEGKIKERLGKQYEEYSGDRTYGPIISSSVESMMSVIYKSRDLGQYRRFIEFNVVKKEDITAGTYNIFENAQEAKNTETIAYKNYGYGIIILVNYLLEILNGFEEYREEHIDGIVPVNEKELLDRFNVLDKKIEDELKNKEKTENITGLTSSSKRFALIILSYQLFRESLIMCRSLYTRSQYTWDETVKMRHDVITQANEIVDQTEAIKDILIRNVVTKFSRADTIISTPDEIKDYIENNKQYFYIAKSPTGKGWYNKEDGIEDNTKYIGKYVEKDGLIQIVTLEKYEILRFLVKHPIPKVEAILECIKKIEADEGNKEQLLSQYGAATEKEVERFKNDNSQCEIQEGASGGLGKEKKSLLDILKLPALKPNKDSDKEDKEKDKGQK